MHWSKGWAQFWFPLHHWPVRSEHSPGGHRWWAVSLSAPTCSVCRAWCPFREWKNSTCCHLTYLCDMLILLVMTVQNKVTTLSAPRPWQCHVALTDHQVKHQWALPDYLSRALRNSALGIADQETQAHRFSLRQKDMSFMCLLPCRRPLAPVNGYSLLRAVTSAKEPLPDVGTPLQH